MVFNKSAELQESWELLLQDRLLIAFVKYFQLLQLHSCSLLSLAYFYPTIIDIYHLISWFWGVGGEF
jgi:hypothetical protein